MTAIKVFAVQENTFDTSVPSFHTTKNTVVSPNFLLWKFCRNTRFRRVSADSPKTLGKRCVSTEFPQQKIS